MALTGNLNDFGAMDVFQLIAGQGKTGILRLYRSGERASFVFSEGKIVSTWDRTATLADPLKTFLLRRKILPERHTMKALRLEARTDIPFAQILLREGMIDLPELQRLVREQIVNEIRGILEWNGGRFEFGPERRAVEYGPGCSIQVENVLLEAARRFDERLSGPENKIPSPDSVPSARDDRANWKDGILHGMFLAVLLAAALSVSYVAIPRGGAESATPLFGVRVAEFNMEREVRNLRLVLEMHRTLFDRYPESLTGLIEAGLLSTGQVAELQNREIRYRSLRGGSRYFLHSGIYGPLVRALPSRSFDPEGTLPDPTRAGSRIEPRR